MENPVARKLHLYLEHAVILKETALSSGNFSIQRSMFKKYAEPNRHHNFQTTLHNRKQTKVAIYRQLEPRKKKPNIEHWSNSIYKQLNHQTNINMKFLNYSEH
jgi:hypothetical protein